MCSSSHVSFILTAPKKPRERPDEGPKQWIERKRARKSCLESTRWCQGGCQIGDRIWSCRHIRICSLHVQCSCRPTHFYFKMFSYCLRRSIPNMFNNSILVAGAWIQIQPIAVKCETIFHSDASFISNNWKRNYRALSMIQFTWLSEIIISSASKKLSSM